VAPTRSKTAISTFPCLLTDSDSSTRAPGGDDDGSGITHLLAIARAIYKKKVQFDLDVELVAFAGEEQGLFGSHAYASKLFCSLGLGN
jgi:Zn-dependent M28 family amino/carboxypeptidase